MHKLPSMILNESVYKATVMELIALESKIHPFQGDVMILHLVAILLYLSADKVDGNARSPTISIVMTTWQRRRFFLSLVLRISLAKVSSVRISCGEM
jgi:hypothetical protein